MAAIFGKLYDLQNDLRADSDRLAELRLDLTSKIATLEREMGELKLIHSNFIKHSEESFARFDQAIAECKQAANAFNTNLIDLHTRLDKSVNVNVSNTNTQQNPISSDLNIESIDTVTGDVFHGQKTTEANTPPTEDEAPSEDE